MNSRVTLYTLIDITCTNARRTQDMFKYKQQQNYQSVIQTLSLRANPLNVEIPKIIEGTDLHFGNITGWKHVWQCNFELGYASGISRETLADDFHLVPVITGLNESVTINPAIFDTTTENRNIIFVFDK
jgi:hypothetical protein